MRVKRTYTGSRHWEPTDVAPFSDFPDLSHGDLRFAAEVAVAVITAKDIPTFAHERAFNTLVQVARS